MSVSCNSRFGVAANDACQLVEPEKAEVVVEVSTADVLRERGRNVLPISMSIFAGDVELTTG